MSKLRPEPPAAPPGAPQNGVLLINLGTPEAPTAAAVRPYLKQFLSDPRVVEIPSLVWWPILNGAILPFRPKKSAEKYAQIWTDHGSPLMHHTQLQAKLLRGYLGEQLGTLVPVEFAMNYGAPSIPHAIEKLRAAGCERIVVFPLYPQYASSATGSALEVVYRHMASLRNMPALSVIKDFHADPRYVRAVADNIRRFWTDHGRPERLLMSFHGLPAYTVKKGDPYRAQCEATGRLLATELGLKETGVGVAFQSRFGRAEWIKPYTAATLEAWGREKIGRVDVVCPGFVSDCLETLEEIAMEGKATFLNAGGTAFNYIPALNEEDAWIKTMTALVMERIPPTPL